MPLFANAYLNLSANTVGSSNRLPLHQITDVAVQPCTMSFLSSILAHPVTVATRYLLGIAGFVATFVIYFKQKSEKKLRWASQSAVVISAGRPDGDAYAEHLAVHWKGEPVTQLTVTRMLIGNAGGESIRGGDIATGDYVRVIPADGVRVLSCDVCESSTHAIRAYATVESDSHVRVGFEFLNSGDAMVLRVVHTGGYQSLTLAGTVIGAGECKPSRDHLPKWLKKGFMLLALVGLVASGVSSHLMRQVTGREDVSVFIGSVVLMLFFCAGISLHHVARGLYFEQRRMRCALSR